MSVETLVKHNGFVVTPHIRVKSAGPSITLEKEAYWDVWGGWYGNHDKRIEDATCSRCGYVYPTIVYGSLSKLPKTCPTCKRKMKTVEY